MDQWYQSHSDRSDSSGRGGSNDDSDDKEYEALQTLIRSGHDSAAPAEPTATQASDKCEKQLAAALCQGLGADVFRTVRSWASQESLLQKYCSGCFRVAT